MINDLINSMFLLVSSFVLWYNCYVLYYTKKLIGYSYWAVFFFTMWGYWNIYYYAYLNQWISWCSEISIVLANTLYGAMLIYYNLKRSK